MIGMSDPGAGQANSVAHARGNLFFFEKKNQKTFALGLRVVHLGSR
jgi:hypothetical protein